MNAGNALVLLLIISSSKSESSEFSFNFCCFVENEETEEVDEAMFGLGNLRLKTTRRFDLIQKR